MNYLYNEYFSVVLSPRGAEMHSVRFDGLERLWQADPEVWNRHAPNLFPLIGRLRDGQYELHGKPVAAPRHGFCRDREFDCCQTDETFIRYTTQDDEETRRVYPFSFRFTVEYRLVRNSIVKTYTVENTGDVPMPFEVGGHDGWLVTVVPTEHMSDYVLDFGKTVDHLEPYGMDENGFLTLPKGNVPLTGGRLNRTPEQLGLDTLVLENVPGNTVTLASTVNPHTVTVEFPDFPYLGIWTAPCGENSRYLCIEPWSALPDAQFSPRELSEKPGVRTLAPGEKAGLTYRVTFDNQTIFG